MHQQTSTDNPSPSGSRASTPATGSTSQICKPTPQVSSQTPPSPFDPLLTFQREITRAVDGIAEVRVGLSVPSDGSPLTPINAGVETRATLHQPPVNRMTQWIRDVRARIYGMNRAQGTQREGGKDIDGPKASFAAARSYGVSSESGFGIALYSATTQRRFHCGFDCPVTKGQFGCLESPAGDRARSFLIWSVYGIAAVEQPKTFLAAMRSHTAHLCKFAGKEGVTTDTLRTIHHALTVGVQNSGLNVVPETSISSGGAMDLRQTWRIPRELLSEQDAVDGVVGSADRSFELHISKRGTELYRLRLDVERHRVCLERPGKPPELLVDERFPTLGEAVAALSGAAAGIGLAS